MMRALRIFLPILMFINFTPLFSEDLRVVINSGHLGSVTAFDISDRYNILFSGGEDGSVRAWDIDSRKLIDMVQASQYPIKKLLIHPHKPHMALIQKNGIHSYRLSVWNWNSKRQIYTRELEEMPLHIDYSPEGSFLVYAETSWDSLTFLQSETGKELPLLTDGFGIVSHFAISSSEKTILAYSPSGKIHYYNIQTGEHKYTFTTLAELEKITFTGNLRFMAAADEDRFVLIDLTSGAVLDYLDLPEIATIAANTLTNEFLCVYSAGENKDSISVINFSRGALSEREITTLNGIVPGTGHYYLNTLYLANTEGDIRLFENMKYGIAKTIQGNNLAPISNLAFKNNTMAFATAENLFFIDSDFFTRTPSRKKPSYFYVNHYESNHTFPAALDVTSEGEFILWQNSPGMINYVDKRDGYVHPDGQNISSELIQLTPGEGKIVTLSADGTCTVLDESDLEPLFSYTGFGIQTAALAGENLFLGKSRASGFNASVLNVNSRTGETVPVFSSSMLIYEAIYNGEDNRIYAIGVEKDEENNTVTVLKSFDNPSFTNEKNLFEIPEEDLFAGIAIDEETDAVMTTLGFNGVVSYSGENLTQFQQKDHIPRKIFIYSNLIYTINMDYTITIWDKQTQRRLMDFYVFQDNNWAAVLASGEYYASYGAQKNIVIYDGIKPASNGDTADLMLR